MKKNLILLTGIVFIIAVLAAGGCNRNPESKEGVADDNDSTEVPKEAEPEETKVDVFLKDTLINGTMHLLMYDSKKEQCEVIDNHTVVVKRGYTVRWRKKQDSKIDKIERISRVGEDPTFFGASPVAEDDAENRSLKLEIPKDAPSDTVIKYEIEFIVKMDASAKKDTFLIDPYLRIPKEVLR